ncbi:Retrovirus-related Pol polyprotein from transposon 17.6 [Vitis vinifera]|uniref:Retrovirus-related Pol polyprotein from transposon 17.6 n=1 Tax=Vitis vinifera TaxID=29760 RepID=A0A438I2A1_VITVI|nr:Retrovirus-related Pol polyprotein from transposon 17.6 [Vitis vinifera]
MVVSYGEDIAVLKKAVLQGSLLGPKASSKVRVPKPKEFNGNRNTKELENFLWAMEQFCKAAHIPDGEKVSITSMNLTGDAKLWWRTTMEDDAEEALKRLRHIGSVKDYVKEFSSLMLDIKNMSEEGKLFNFMSGLQGWAQTELRRQGVRDLPVAMATINCLVDYKMGGDISTMQDPSQKEARRLRLMARLLKSLGGRNRTRRLLLQEENQWRRSQSLCSRPPDDDKRDSDSKTPPRVNPLQLLNVINGETPIQKSLMHVHAVVNGVQVKALMDSGATHNFVATREATRLGLKLEKDTSRIKAVNTKPRRSKGAKVALIPHLGGLVVLEEKQPCFVKALRAKDGELPKELPPRRPIDHKIELLPRTKAPAQAPYRMPPAELLELLLFQNEHDGSLCMCVDYRALNNVTIKNKYPIPLAVELFDRLSKPLTSPSWTCDRATGKLTNAPATFCNLMNDVLFYYLNAFVVVYLDDIMVYSKTLTEHEKHLRLVFQRLRENRLYVKPEKYEFAQEEITFLGHKISADLIRMDKGKVQAIMKWPVPTKVTELQSFFGLTNYYRRFIKGYSKRVSPLTDLLKKDNQWDWSMQCQMTFKGLKEAISTEPVLQLLDLDLPFEVQTDASDRALGGVLVQEGHPMAFESRKLNNAE